MLGSPWSSRLLQKMKARRGDGTTRKYTSWSRLLGLNLRLDVLRVVDRAYRQLCHCIPGHAHPYDAFYTFDRVLVVITHRSSWYVATH